MERIADAMRLNGVRIERFGDDVAIMGNVRAVGLRRVRSLIQLTQGSGDQPVLQNLLSGRVWV